MVYFHTYHQELFCINKFYEMSGTASRDRLQPLEKIELNIISAMQCAGKVCEI